MFVFEPVLSNSVRSSNQPIFCPHFNRSVNGSPVDQFDGGEVFITAKKRRAVDKTENTPFPIAIGVGAGNGETIDLSDPNQRKNLDGEQKAEAMQQIIAMQEQMANLVANW